MPFDIMPFVGFTILVVEDEPLIALDIATTLEDAGAEVIVRVIALPKRTAPLTNMIGHYP